MSEEKSFEVSTRYENTIDVKAGMGLNLYLDKGAIISIKSYSEGQLIQTYTSQGAACITIQDDAEV